MSVTVGHARRTHGLRRRMIPQLRHLFRVRGLRAGLAHLALVEHPLPKGGVVDLADSTTAKEFSQIAPVQRSAAFDGDLQHFDTGVGFPDGKDARGFARAF